MAYTGRGLYITLMMETVSYYETSVNICHSTRCYSPEDSHLYTRRRENFRSYIYR
jgi:hypothetical protein